MRAWWAGVGAFVLLMAPAAAAPMRVSITELKEGPELYYGQTVSLDCYYDKESPIWVRALPDAEQWVGFFVTGTPAHALTWRGEYYNLVFAPYRMREAVRSLRAGDRITIIGEVFHYRSASLDGAGIHVQQILTGTGATAAPLGSGTAPPVPQAQGNGKYLVTINGKRYEGLRYGDHYTFDGIEFEVEQQP